MLTTPDSISSVVSAAMGDIHADTIITNCNLFSVYTGSIIPDMQISIHKDRITYVGNNASHTAGPDTKTVDVRGRYVSPGLADPHIHIDQFVMPSEFARESLLCGVTSLFSDPIDVVSVAGHKGFEVFLEAGRNLPIRIFQTIPGGLPVDPKFSRHKGGKATRQQYIKTVLQNADVPGMGEVFSWTKVTRRDPHTMELISDMTNHNCIINGHTAGASGAKLAAYVASGIHSCHEPIDYDQVEERLRLGMWIMIREGSIRRDLKSIVSRLVEKKTYLDRLMFCSDGLDPAAIRKYGHINYCIKEAVRLGIKPIDAVIMATRNVFDYYMMGRDLGVIAPGRLADIVIFEDAKSFKPNMVMVGGKTVVSKGRLIAKIPFAKKIPRWIKQTVDIPKVSVRDFEIYSKDPKVKSANTIVMHTEIITKMGTTDVTRDKKGRIIPVNNNVLKVAAFERVPAKDTRQKKRRAIAYLEGLGTNLVGAFASTWSFHENDMIVIGSDDAEMARVANYLRRCNGGVAVSDQGRITASMPLQFAGIVSTKPFDTVLEEFEQVNTVLADAGCKFDRPLLVPMFLPFLALPSVRMTSKGIIDVKKQQQVALLLHV